MIAAEPLYLSARSQSLLAPAKHGSETLDTVPCVHAQLRAIGWRRALEDECGGAGFFGDLCAYALVDTDDEARLAISRFSRFLDVNAEHTQMRACLIQGWEVSETMDRLRKGLTVRWSRRGAADFENHPNVVMLQPRWAIR